MLINIVKDSIVFLLLSLLIIAASLYLPEHIFVVTKRIFYYVSGDEETLTNANNAAHQVYSSATQLIRDGGHSSGALAGNGRALMDV